MINPSQVLMRNAELTANFIIDVIKKDIEQQGRRIDVKMPGYAFTGEESLDWEVRIQGDQFVLNIIGNDYIIKMDSPQTPSQINYRPEDLIDYARKIKPDLSRADQLAYLRRLKSLHKRVGVPNRYSYSWSRNGRRTGWSKYGVEKNLNKIDELVNLFSYVDALIGSIYNDINGEIAA